MNRYVNHKLLRYALGLLQLFIGVSAIAGGAKLVLDPSGAGLQIPLHWLVGSPFSSYFIPGLVLLVMIGAGTTLASVFTIFGNRNADLMAVGSGMLLILFITAEVWFIGFRVFLQPLYLILGGVEVALGLRISRIKRTADLGWLTDA